MYHRIEFTAAFTVDVELSPGQRLERLRLRKGTQASVRLRPHVVETDGELREVADLFFADGTVARQVPYEWFRFVDE